MFKVIIIAAGLMMASVPLFAVEPSSSGAFPHPGGLQAPEELQAPSRYAQEKAVAGLAARIMPGHGNQLVFRIKPAGRGRYFKVYSSRGKVTIEADCAVSAACGLRRYMQQYLGASVTWNDFTPRVAERLPLPVKPVTGESPYGFVTYMNYCTFGYTTAYWDWQRWEQEIDWMALHGVTAPLAMTGTEVVWRRFLVRAGYSDDQARRFLPGASYLPWFHMANMSALGGPAADEWFGRQEALQHRIVERMRSLGMEPVFQGYCGFVPAGFGERFPATKVVDQGEWFGFVRPALLSPLDPEFERLAKIWYEEYDALYGKTRYYGGDLFHEGGRKADLDVTACVRAVGAGMRRHNPQAVWIVQGWQDNPTHEILAGLDPRHSLVIELCGEYWHRWLDRGGYEGIPWAWSCISNWGGNTGLHGRLDIIASHPARALNDPAACGTYSGIGFTPEGIETNPIVAELWSDMVWSREPVAVDRWLAGYVRYRYGSDLPCLLQAWQGFHATAYGSYKDGRQPSESIFCAEPSLDADRVSEWSSCAIHYDHAQFEASCAEFLEAARALRDNPGYCYDAVDAVRQCISNRGLKTWRAVQAAWAARDREAFDHQTELFLRLILLDDKLLRSHPAFCLDHWLQEARDAGTNTAQSNRYELYSRMLLTSWSDTGTDLNDYAHREWGGMLGTYYHGRWQLFFNYLDRAWYDDTLPPPDTFGYTRNWLYKSLKGDIEPSGTNPADTAAEIFRQLKTLK